MILTADECRKVYNDAMTLPVRNAVAVMRHIESALLDKLLKGVEVPEADVRIYRGFATHSTKQLLQYGAAQRLAGREQAIEEWRVHLLELWEKGNFDLKDALAASPQEKK